MWETFSLLMANLVSPRSSFSLIRDLALCPHAWYCVLKFYTHFASCSMLVYADIALAVLALCCHRWMPG